MATAATLQHMDQSDRGIEGAVIEWTESVYEEAEQQMVDTPEIKLTTKLIDYLHSKQWTGKSRFSRNRPVANRIVRQFIDTVGLLSDIDPDFQTTMNGKINGYSGLEEIINKLVSRWAMTNHFESELTQVVMYGLLHTGPAKFQWNPLLLNGLGDTEMINLSPMNFMMLGASTGPQDAECCIVRQVKSVDALVRRYGKIARSVVPDVAFSELSGGDMMRPNRISKESWSRMPETLRRLTGAKMERSTSKYPRAMQKEFWLRDASVNDRSASIVVGPKDERGKPKYNWSYIVEPGMPLYPRGRVIVTAGGKVLADDPNPYWHAKFPFALYRPFRVPWQLYGMSSMEPLMLMQNIINRINGGVMDMINATIEPTLIAPKNAFAKADWDSLDPGASGGKIGYNNNAAKEPQFAKRDRLDSGVFQFKQDIEKEMDQTSGSSAISQALNKKQIPGQDSLEMIKSSRSTNIRLMGKNLETFLSEGGYMTVSNIIQFYTMKHRIRALGIEGVTGNDFQPVYGESLPDGVRGEDFVAQYGFEIRPGSALAYEKDDDIQVAFALRKNRDISRRGLYRTLQKKGRNIDVDRIEKELDDEMLKQAKIAQLVGAGHGKK